MIRFSPLMKKVFYTMAVYAFGLCATRSAQALMISGVGFTPSAITTETTGVSSGTVISFTIDTPGQVTVNIVGGIQNFGDSGVLVATLNQFYSSAGAQSIYWNGLWPIAGTVNPGGRSDGNYQFTLTLTTTSASYASEHHLRGYSWIKRHPVARCKWKRYLPLRDYLRLGKKRRCDRYHFEL
jgi:hypothetical protein